MSNKGFSFQDYIANATAGSSLTSLAGTLNGDLAQIQSNLPRPPDLQQMRRNLLGRLLHPSDQHDAVRPARQAGPPTNVTWSMSNLTTREIGSTFLEVASTSRASKRRRLSSSQEAQQPSSSRSPKQPAQSPLRRNHPEARVTPQTQRRGSTGRDRQPANKPARNIPPIVIQPPSDDSENSSTLYQNATTATAERGRRRKTAKPQRLGTAITRMMDSIHDVQRLQETNRLIVPRLPFARIVRDITHKIVGPSSGYRYTVDALETLQFIAEHYLTAIFSNASIVAAHARRVTVMQKDFDLLHRLGLLEFGELAT